MKQLLKEIFGGVVPQGMEELRTHAGAIVAAAFVLWGLFFLHLTQLPSFWSWLSSLPAVFVILLTSLVRLNDMTAKHKSWNYQVRRLGFVMTGTSAVGYGMMALAERPMYPSWLAVGFLWGLALCWLTTPNTPPWWNWITRDRTKKEMNRGPTKHIE